MKINLRPAKNWLGLVWNYFTKKPYLFASPLLIWLIIDTINGFLLKNFDLPLSLSQIFKFASMLLIVPIINDKKVLKMVIVGFATMLFISLIHIFHPLTANSSPLAVFVEDLIFGLKLLSPVVFFAGFFSLSKRLKESDFDRFVSAVFWINFAVIVFNSILVKLGYGYSQYANRIGSKGLFVSGNELAITFVTVSGYLLYRHRTSPSVFLLGLAAIILVCSILIGLKVAIFGTVLLIALTLILLRYNVSEQLFTRQKIKRGYKVWIVLIIIFGIISFALLGRAMHDNRIFSRVTYMYKISGDNPISAITSQRDVLAKEAFQYIKNDYTASDFVFGVGYKNSFEAMKKYPPHRFGISELDFVDLFLFGGSIAILYYFLWALYIVRLFYIAKRSSLFLFVGTLNFVLFAASTISGHTIYSAINAPFWGIINAIALKQTSKLDIKVVWKNIKKMLRHLWRKSALNILPFYFTITVDVINGIFRTDQNWQISLSQIWKGIMLGLLLPLLQWKQITKLILLGFFCVVLIVIHLHHPVSTMTGKTILLKSEAVFYLKLVTPLVFTFALITLQNKISKKDFNKLILWVFLLNFFAIVINQLLALRGHSHLIQLIKQGEKGAFISWNETAITYVTIVSFLLFKARNKKTLLIVFLFALFSSFTFMLSKRVSLLGTSAFVILTAIFFRYGFIHKVLSRKRINLKKQLSWVAVFIILALGTLSAIIFSASRSSVNLFNSGQLAKIQRPFESVSRSRFAENASRYIEENFRNQDYIFGIGYGNIENAVKEYQPLRPGITEIDIIDLYLSNGLFAGIYYLLWIGFLFWLLKNVKKSQFIFYALLINAFLLASSLTSGHVIYSSMNAPFWSIINAVAIIAAKRNSKSRKLRVVILGGTGTGGVGSWATTVGSYLKTKLSRRFQIISNHGELYQNIRNSLRFVVGTVKTLIYCTINQSDLIIIHLNVEQGNSFVRAAYTASLLKPFRNVRIIPHIHGAKFFPYIKKLTKSSRGKRLFNSLFENPRISAVISLTNLRKKRLKKLFEDEKLQYHFKIQTIHNPIEFNKIKNLRKNTIKKRLELIYVGRLVEQKNILLALKAVKRLVDTGSRKVHFNIVGDGETRSKLESYVKDNKLSKYITFYGWVPHDKIGELYKKSNIFVLPSKFESFGIVLVEAFANCLPAVATNVGGVPEVCQQNKNGYIVSSKAPEEMAAAIQKFIDRPTLLTTIGYRNYKRAKEFDISVIGNKLFRLYKKVYKSKKKLLLIASSGGHLVQLMMLKKWWRKYDRMFVAYNKIDSRTKLAKEKHYFSNHTSIRNPLDVFANTLHAIKIIRKYKPDLIFSTGEGIAVPFFYVGKYFFGKKTVFLDTLSKSHKPSLAAKLLYFTADELLTQSKSIAERYKRFKYKGTVI